MEIDSYKAVIERLYDHLAAQEESEIRDFLIAEELHHIAAILDRLDRFAASEVFQLLPPERQSEVIVFVQRHTLESIVDELTDDQLFAFLQYNDEDDATDTLQFISEKRRDRILKKFENVRAKKIQTLLHFDARSAGGIMDAHYIIVKPSFRIMDIADKLQSHYSVHEKIPLVLVTNDQGALLGVIPHRVLILNEAMVNVEDIIEPVETVSVEIDQEELLTTIQRSSNDFIVVIDEKIRPLGVVHVKDLLRIAQQEATEDVYKFAGVQKAESAFEITSTKVHRRYKWLVINLGTAFFASWVVSFFQDSISQLAMLAVFMPIVAGEGGNAATQSLAVVVRGLATQDIAWSDAKTIIIRETFAGVMNGVIVGFIAAFIALLFGATPMLGVVLGVAMVTNLCIAGFFGSLIPFILKAFHIDPATASSIFVTTATDVFGFLTFLGLATIVLL